MNEFRITVGIIGHIDAIVTPKHILAIKQIFEDLFRLYPNSPVTLFSQLARGADTEVAKIFLEIKEKTKRDYQMVVPLPFELESYKRSIGQQGLVTFNQLLSKAEKSFVLKSEANLSENQLFRQGGQFIADGSIILIALWDGIENGKTGGTADIVRYVREGTFHDKVIDNFFDSKRNLIHLRCNRRQSSIRKEIYLDLDCVQKLLIVDKSIKKALEEIENFNLKKNGLSLSLLQQSMNYLFPEPANLSGSNANLINYYGVIDTFAVKFQKSYKRVIMGLFGFGIIGFSYFEYYKQFGAFANVLASGIIILGFVFVFVEFSRLRKIHQKYIDARVLAEALRIQFFWNLIGLPKSVSDYILSIHKTEFNWLRHFLSSVSGTNYPDQVVTRESIKLTSHHWIKDQVDYFKNKITHMENKKIAFNWASITLFIISIMFFIGIVILKYNGISSRILQKLVVIDTVIFGIAMLLRAYYDKMGFDQISNQYRLMHKIYIIAMGQINKINENPNLSPKEKHNQIQRVFELTGKEALVENGYWYMIYKDKDPDIEGFN